MASTSLSGATSSYYQQAEHGGTASPTKYPENGHDTLSDFVTFVCQEAENTQQTGAGSGSNSGSGGNGPGGGQPGPSRTSPSKIAQYYPSSMLPPPPPPPMARPVAIIRSTGELTVTATGTGSSSASPPAGGSTPPPSSSLSGNGDSSPRDGTARGSVSPPASSTVEVIPTSRSVVTSPFSRDYAFAHIHTPPTQVIIEKFNQYNMIQSNYNQTYCHT